MTVTVEEKHPELRGLIALGKERGYLLYDEIFQALPEDVSNTPDELDSARALAQQDCLQ